MVFFTKEDTEDRIPTSHDVEEIEADWQSLVITVQKRTESQVELYMFAMEYIDALEEAGLGKIEKFEALSAKAKKHGVRLFSRITQTINKDASKKEPCKNCQSH